MVGKAVIRQAFIRKMPKSVRAHLPTQPDSASLESLAMLADRAVAAEKDVDEAKPGVAEIQVSESGKLVGQLEDLSHRLKKLETAIAAKKKTYGPSQATENRATKTQFVPNVQAKPFIPNSQNVATQNVSTNNKVILTHRRRVAANNTTINTYGTSRRVVDFGLKRDYPWTFIVADIKQPIIGADFLIHYSLLVDLKSLGLAIPATLSSINPLSLNRVDTVQNDYTKLLGQFPELTRSTTKGEPVKHGITHKIVTKGHPIFTLPRRLAPDKH